MQRIPVSKSKPVNNKSFNFEEMDKQLKKPIVPPKSCQSQLPKNEEERSFFKIPDIVSATLSKADDFIKDIDFDNLNFNNLNLEDFNSFNAFNEDEQINVNLQLNAQYL